MLVHKGGQINIVQLITGLRIAEMSQLQNCSVMCTKNGSYCDNDKKERYSQGGGGGGGGGCTKNGSYCEKKKSQGGRVGGGGVQGGCELRSEAFVKIQKKKKIFFFFFFFFFGGGSRWMCMEKAAWPIEPNFMWSRLR